MAKKKKTKEEPEEDKDPEEDSDEDGEIKLDFSELEDVDDEIEKQEIMRTLQPIRRIAAPALDQIAEMPEIFSGETGFSENNLEERGTRNEDDRDPFKYLPQSENNENETKYISSSAHITATPEQVDFENVGRQTRELQPQNQEAFFQRSKELNGTSATHVEKYTAAKSINEEEAGRKDPFEREKKDYHPSLPKS